jgi:predicted ester cyclase
MDRRGVLLGAAVAVGGVAGARAASAGPEAAVRRLVAALNAHDMAAFADVLAADYVNHQASAAAPAPPAGVPHKAGTVAFFRARVVGMPDLRVSLETMVSDGDKVAASFVYEGTHGGVLYGVAPTGRPLRFTSCDIYRVRDGLIVEHWGMGDLAGVLAQLKA